VKTASKALLAALLLASPAARAEMSLQPRAFVGASTPVGDASRISDAALDLGLGGTLGQGRFRGRATLAGRRGLGVGDGASLTFFRFGLGVDARVWRSLELALEAGPSIRRISVGDELTYSTIGVAGALEVGWRFRPSSRWSFTPTVQWTTAWYEEDYVVWNDIALLLSVQPALP
jgi:hypothetical protein